MIVDMQPKGNLPMMKPDDMQYFDKLLVDEETLSPEEQKDRKITKLLLKIKNGTPPMRKAAMRQMTNKAREFGAGPLFNQILPLFMSPTLEDQERHLLVKVIDRILYKLDDLVRPYVHKILVVIEPMLIDEDYYARVEGQEIISHLAKAVGLATMIATMRPDIDNMDEYVRNTTARAFAVVASALDIPSLLPFLKAVCKSKKSWQARHTGIKIVQQISILMGCAILPHLKSLVDIIEHGLVDEQQKVRTITALALAALAEAATPYGIESFDSVLKPLWKGIRQHKGKGLAAFLKAIGHLIPLMDPDYADYYTQELLLFLIPEFQSSDEEIKKIALKAGIISQKMDEETKAGVLKALMGSDSQQKLAVKRRCWDQAGGDDTPAKKKSTSWDAEEAATSSNSRWDETPGRAEETLGHGSGWAETPKTDRGDLIERTPTPGASKRRSRWDETPAATPSTMTPSMTPGAMTPSMIPQGMTPGGMTPSMTPSDVTPTGSKAMAMATPVPGSFMSMTPEQTQAFSWHREIDERNRPQTDDDLEAMFPPGYKVLPPPAGYVPIRTPGRKLLATPTPMAGTPMGFCMQTPDIKSSKEMIVDMQLKGNLPDDMQYFDKLRVDVDEETLSPEEQKSRKIMNLILKIKNGTPPMRKVDVDEETLSPEEQKSRKIMNLILKIKNGTPPMRKVDVDEETLSPEEQKSRKIMNLILKIKNGTPPMRKVDVDEETLSPEEQKSRKIMNLILKIKNGTPPMRKAAMRQMTNKAREFGAGPLFNQILPMLMLPTLEDHEHHLLVKVIDKIIYKLDDLVRPYVHKILVVIEPLLIDEDYYARVQGQEIISNLAKAAGLATMIATMRPDIDNRDVFVRNITARAFAVITSALGIPSLLPFLKAVCKSKKSWQARHTGIKIVQQISILMGCAILPHLKSLVKIIGHGLVDKQQKVRTITSLALAALAEAATPYGIESFDSVLKPLWKGIRQHKGKLFHRILRQYDKLRK